MIRNIRQIISLDILKTLMILVLAFYITYIPHQANPYPVHGDEWVHLAYSNALIKAEGISFDDPFSGESILDPYRISLDPEAGFHLFWVIFHSITGISWLTIFKYFPSIIFMITVLTVYIFAKREGFGWEAAFFTCLLPTTVGILGPAFLVPLSIGLLFVPLILYVTFSFQNWHSYLLLCIINLFLLIMHPPSAVIIFTILIPFIMLNIRRNFKHSLGMTLALVIPIVASLPWTLDTVVIGVERLLSVQAYVTHTDVPSIIQAFGYLPIAFSVLGTAILFIKGDKKNYGLIFGLFILLALLLIFSRFHYGEPLLYKRGLMYLMLMLAITGGAGLAWLRTFGFNSKSANFIWSFLAHNAGSILCLVLMSLVLVISISVRQQTSYYQIINNEDYQAFIWIRDKLDEKYDKAILDPWKATAFTAITQRNIYTRIHLSVQSTDRKAYDFFADGCTDTYFLRENGISIVYGNCGSNNPDLIEVRDKVYVVREIEKK